MMIGHAKKKDGLYYLEAPGNPSVSKKKIPLSFRFEHFITNKDKIRFYHLRLGEFSFGVLKVMFPSSFKGLGNENFHSDACGKHGHKLSNR